MKVLAIASAGGHWVQLLRLKPAFAAGETVYLSTQKGNEKFVPESKFVLIPDSNRKNKLQLVKSFMTVYKVIRTEKPQAIVTTGAAPGLMGIVIGRLLGIKTIWIDSIANVETLSLSGKIASRFADRVYTQWPDLATKDIQYSGNVLG